MRIRFQADADLNQVIVSAVVRRVPAIEFRTAPSGRLAGLDDQQVIALAAVDGRVLVTHDQATMPRHFREFVRSQRSPRAIVVPQHLPVRDAADGVEHSATILRVMATDGCVLKNYRHPTSHETAGS